MEKTDESRSVHKYQSFLLRLWSEPADDHEDVWRYVLIDPQSGKQWGFSSLDELVEYLRLLTQA